MAGVSLDHMINDEIRALNGRILLLERLRAAHVPQEVVEQLVQTLGASAIPWLLRQNHGLGGSPISLMLTGDPEQIGRVTTLVGQIEAGVYV